MAAESFQAAPTPPKGQRLFPASPAAPPPSLRGGDLLVLPGDLMLLTPWSGDRADQTWQGLEEGLVAESSEKVWRFSSCSQQALFLEHPALIHHTSLEQQDPALSFSWWNVQCSGS